jgi:hypothetical protein
MDDVGAMSQPVICALGWQLDHAAIEAIEFAENARIAHCDALFLAAGSVSQLWRRAVGHPVRSFRSAVYERHCWSTLAALDQQLRRLLRRGGVLFVRLDYPESVCRVSCRPDDPRLPVGSPIDVYDALAAVDPLLAAIARGRRPLSSSTTRPRTMTTDVLQRRLFSPYLEQANRHVFASLVLADIDGLAQPLLLTPEGDCVAATSEQIVLLPPLGMPDSRHEASCMLAILDRLMTERSPGHRTPIIEEPLGKDSAFAGTVNDRSATRVNNLADWVLTPDERAVLSSS